MFEKKRSLRERSTEFRDPLRPLTDAEAETARAIHAIALMEQLHLDLCEVKQRLQVIDQFLERTAGSSYRHPDDMRRLREGVS
jgi:5'-deoxynucleotidase YfbR-like HD superfamily hydrolase